MDGKTRSRMSGNARCRCGSYVLMSSRRFGEGDEPSLRSPARFSAFQTWQAQIGESVAVTVDIAPRAIWLGSTRWRTTNSYNKHEPTQEVRTGLREGLGVLTFLFTSSTGVNSTRIGRSRTVKIKLSRQLADRAFDLANQGREDEEAVNALIAAAGRHRKQLRRAAAGFRYMGRADENVEYDRATRLLRAAAERQPVRQPSAEKTERLQTLKSLQEQPVETGFEFLVLRQPALRQLDGDVRAAGTEESETSVELRRKILWDTFRDRISALVGTEAQDAPDPILRTRTAALLANRHLGVVFGLPDPGARDEDA